MPHHAVRSSSQCERLRHRRLVSLHLSLEESWSLCLLCGTHGGELPQQWPYDQDAEGCRCLCSSSLHLWEQEIRAVRRGHRATNLGKACGPYVRRERCPKLSPVNSAHTARPP